MKKIMTVFSILIVVHLWGAVAVGESLPQSVDHEQSFGSPKAASPPANALLASGNLPKHYYCWEPAGQAGVCRTCWSNLDGEGGRTDCAARMGQGSVSYGDCNEERNRRWCVRQMD